MSNDLDLDEPRDPILVVPIPRRYLMMGWVGLSVLVAMGSPLEYNVLAHDPATVPGKHGDLSVSGIDRWFYVGIYGLIFFAVPIAAGLAMPWLPYLRIGKAGFKAKNINVTWDKVAGCHWNRYRPGTLEVQTHDLRGSFFVDARHRAKVEASLRKLGKWES